MGTIRVCDNCGKQDTDMKNRLKLSNKAEIGSYLRENTVVTVEVFFSGELCDDCREAVIAHERQLHAVHGMADNRHIYGKGASAPFKWSPIAYPGWDPPGGEYYDGG